MTQKEMVKNYLNKRGSITTWQAFEDLGILDLQGVIRNLKEEMDIDFIQITKKNRYGHPVSFKKYFIPKPENNFFGKIFKKNW